MANGNPYYVAPVGHGASPLFAGFQQGLGLRQQMKQMAMEQALKEQQLKQAEFGGSTSLGATDASLGLPTAGQPMANAQGPSAPVPVPNAVALPWMEKRMEAQERSKDRGLQRDIAGQGKAVGYANQFRDEFNQLSKPFQTIVPMYKNVVASATTPNPTAASDMGLIFSYMKILDPASTVREGEYATAQNAGSIPDAIRNQYNRLKDGEKLQPGQRMNFAKSAQMAFKSASDIQGQHMSRYTDLASRSRINPSDVIYDYGQGMGQESFELPTTTAAPGSDGWMDAGDGVKIRKKVP